MQKELFDKLDMYDFSKELFISNYKLLKKEKRRCLKTMNDIKNDLKESSDYYKETNLFNLDTVYRIILMALKMAKKILEEGANRKNVELFYRTIVHLYVREGNEWNGTRRIN